MMLRKKPFQQNIRSAFQSIGFPAPPTSGAQCGRPLHFTPRNDRGQTHGSSHDRHRLRLSSFLYFSFSLHGFHFDFLGKLYEYRFRSHHDIIRFQYRHLSLSIFSFLLFFFTSPRFLLLFFSRNVIPRTFVRLFSCHLITIDIPSVSRSLSHCLHPLPCVARQSFPLNLHLHLALMIPLIVRILLVPS